jgi:kinesin family protein 18/19
MSSQTKFKVAVRVRPMLPHEHSTCVNCVNFNSTTITCHDPFDLKHQRAGRQMDVIHRSKESKFAFDFVFSTEPVERIFRLCAKDIVEDSINGYKGCVFAYGATGSGKTYTMMGNATNGIKGMNERCLEEIFELVKADQDYDYKITASFVEIYNEYIIDLLKPKNKDYLELWDDPVQGTIVAGVKELEVTNISSVIM